MIMVMCFSRLWNEPTSLLFNCSLLTKHATRLKEMSAMLGKWVSYHTSQGKLDLHCYCSFCWGNLYPLFRVKAVIGSSCLPMFWLNHLNVIKIKEEEKGRKRNREEFAWFLVNECKVPKKLVRSQQAAAYHMLFYFYVFDTSCYTL